MLVSEKITCINAYSSGCSRLRFGSCTGSENSFTSSVALVTKNNKYFPGICEATGCKTATPPIPGLCIHRNYMFLYSLLKSAANAVLRLMSAVTAIAHVLFVSIKSLFVHSGLFEYSFGKLINASTTLPMSGFLGSSPVSGTNVSLAFLYFFINSFFLVWVSPSTLPGQKYQSILLFNSYIFYALMGNFLNRDTGFLWVRC